MNLYPYHDTSKLLSVLGQSELILSNSAHTQLANTDYDYIWAKQNISLEKWAEFKDKHPILAGKVKNTKILIFSLVLLLLCLLINPSFLFALYATGIIGLFILAIGVIIIFTCLAYVLKQQSEALKNIANSRRYSYYLNCNQIVILENSINEIISRDVIYMYRLAHSATPDTDGLTLHVSDKTKPITIYCDNAEEIADFINQQLRKIV